jgi:ABC-2 type transport system permease protein
VTTTFLPASRVFRRRASLAQALSHTLTMAYRGLLRVKRTPEQLFDVTLQPVLFTVMFTYLFGGAIAGDPAKYLPFLLPGILVQAVITMSVVTGVQLREDMDSGVFDRIRSLPIARIAPLAGALLADSLRYALGATITFIVGYVMGYRPEGGVVSVVAASLLVITCSWAVSWIFAFLGVIARSASSVQGISMIVLFPLTFLSNAYVPAATMPSWLQVFVKLNPLSHLVSAARDLTQRGTVSSDIWFSLLGAAVIVAVFAPLTVRAYMRKA